MRIGVFGGTFDPVHFGHLMLADQMADALALERVLFVPSNRPPHKDESTVAPIQARLDMLLMVVGDDPRFELSMVECRFPGKSYSFRTMEILAGEYAPGTEFFFLIGSDTLLGLEKFARFERLAMLCAFAAAMRPGDSLEDAAAARDSLRDRYGADVHLVPFTETAVSSTLIRERIARGESARYMLPDDVLDYIARHGLYQSAGGGGAENGAGGAGEGGAVRGGAGAGGAGEGGGGAGNGGAGEGNGGEGGAP
jgi:nicotinate-nucleotide adenylyltransferase